MAIFTAHSYLHFELPDMPFLDYSRPASSGYHSNAPNAVKSWDVLAIITQWAEDADNTQVIDQPRIVRSLRRCDGTAEAAVIDAVQQLLLATSDYVEDQFLAGTSRMFRIESLAHTSGNSVPEIARGRSCFTDKVVYFADEVDKQYKKAILTVELKQPGVLKSRAEQPAPSLSGVWNSRIADQGQRTAPVTEEDRQVDSIMSNKLASLICQLWEYMCWFGSIYGALSSGELLYLARREGPELLISPAIHWSDSTPTVLAALAYVFTQGMEDVEQLPLLEPVYCSIPSMDADDDDDNDKEQRDKSKTATDSDETSHPDKISRKRKRGKPASSLGVMGRLARHVTLRDVPEESLHIEKVIAQGASGNIAEGRIHDTRVAIKLAPLASSRGPMLVREAGALLQLRPLWDRYVVGLVDYGTLMDEEYVFIATRLTPGTHPHLMASTPAIKQKALKTLCAVHAAGIIHGDLRSENILVSDAESKEPTVMLLDFGAATRCSKPRRQKEEEAQLEEVFRV